MDFLYQLQLSSIPGLHEILILAIPAVGMLLNSCIMIMQLSLHTQHSYGLDHKRHHMSYTYSIWLSMPELESNVTPQICDGLSSTMPKSLLN